MHEKQIEIRWRDQDAYDAVAEHLLVIDHEIGSGPEAVVGTYRLIQQAGADAVGDFYSAAEYDIGPILSFPGQILELGRSCVDARYRGRAVMQLLWRGITAYVFHNQIALLFGCASLPGTDLDALARRAVEMLVERVGGFTGVGRHELVDIELLVRESAPAASP